MPRNPTDERVRAAVTGVMDAHAGTIRTVIAHGSWVRGDFWPGQSDLDLIVVGVGASTPTWIRSKLEALSPTLGVHVESWEISETAIEGLRRTRADGRPISECGIVQFDINGFDVVDRHEVVWGDPGRDPVQGFPVPRGRCLQSFAVRRLHVLRGEIPLFAAEINRIACDALKAATIFFLLKGGQEPTRNKDEVFDRFFDVVPVFNDRETARAIWSLYRAGDKSGDSAHREACQRFVDALEGLVTSAA
jgi:predicted nucleotidyltransferase